MTSEDKYINSPEFEALIKDCIALQPKAQRKFYECFYAFVKSICMRYTSKLEDCEEVLDDSFMKVYRNLEKYDFDKPFKAWLRTIVVNTAIDFYRLSSKQLQMQSVEDHVFIHVESHALHDLGTEDILKAIQKLSPAYRTVFMLYAVDGYNHKEIGNLLGITEGTSKSNLAKARMKLQDLLISMYGKESLAPFLKYSVPSNL